MAAKPEKGTGRIATPQSQFTGVKLHVACFLHKQGRVSLAVRSTASNLRTDPFVLQACPQKFHSDV